MDGSGNNYCLSVTLLMPQKHCEETGLCQGVGRRRHFMMRDLEEKEGSEGWRERRHWKEVMCCGRAGGRRRSMKGRAEALSIQCLWRLCLPPLSLSLVVQHCTALLSQHWVKTTPTLPRFCSMACCAQHACPLCLPAMPCLL